MFVARPPSCPAAKPVIPLILLSQKGQIFFTGDKTTMAKGGQKPGQFGFSIFKVPIMTHFMRN